MTSVLLLLVCVGLFSTADWLASRWAMTGGVMPLGFVLVVGPCAYLLFGHLAATGSLAKVGSYVNAGVVVGTVLAGVFLLGERPDRTAWTGIACIVLGLAMLAAGRVDTSP